MPGKKPAEKSLLVMTNDIYVIGLIVLNLIGAPQSRRLRAGSGLRWR